MKDWDDAVRVFEANLTQEYNYLTLQMTTILQPKIMALRASFKDAAQTLGSLPDDRLFRACAQHIVNNLSEAGGSDVTAAFWKANRDEIMKVVTPDNNWKRWHNGNHELAMKTIEAKTRLATVLAGKRETLCEEYDIPWARQQAG